MNHLHIYSETEGWEPCVNGVCPMDDKGHTEGQNPTESESHD